MFNGMTKEQAKAKMEHVKKRNYRFSEEYVELVIKTYELYVQYLESEELLKLSNL